MFKATESDLSDLRNRTLELEPEIKKAIITTDMRWFLALGSLFTFVAVMSSTLTGNFALADFRRSNVAR